MRRLDAHELTARHSTEWESLLPVDLEADPAVVPAILVAFAVVSQQLDDCRTWPELREAIRHGVALVNCEVVSREELQHQANWTATLVYHSGRACAQMLKQPDPSRRFVSAN